MMLTVTAFPDVQALRARLPRARWFRLRMALRDEIHFWPHRFAGAITCRIVGHDDSLADAAEWYCERCLKTLPGDPPD
jgi:hypothetical protein